MGIGSRSSGVVDDDDDDHAVQTQQQHQTTPNTATATATAPALLSSLTPDDLTLDEKMEYDKYGDEAKGLFLLLAIEKRNRAIQKRNLAIELAIENRNAEFNTLNCHLRIKLNKVGAAARATEDLLSKLTSLSQADGSTVNQGTTTDI